MAATRSELPPGPAGPPLAHTLAWVGAPERFMRSALRRHGPAFTVQLAGEGPCVYLADPEGIRAVFAAGPQGTLAGAVNRQLAPVVGRRSLLLLDGDEHLARRRVLSAPFHGAHLARWAAVIDAVAREHVARWPGSGPLALRPRLQALTLEAVLEVLLGAGPADERERVRVTVLALLRIAASPLALVPALRRELGGRGPWAAFLRARAATHAALDAAIARRRRAPCDDVAGLLAAADLPDDELRDQLITLVLAGHETTATALTWALLHVARDPQAQAALAAEARSGGGPWAGAVADETLRLHPPVPVVGRTLLRGMRLAGFDLPPRTVVVPAIWLVGRRADLFPAPDAFRPRRFLDARPDPLTWLPFGGGARRCLGAGFARLEMEVVLRAVAARRRLVPAGRRPPEPRWRALVRAPAGDGRVLVEAA